jgi:ribonuclease HI
MKCFLYTDGGARGNPGPGAIGVVLKDENGKVIFELSKYIGRCTNNEAEYTALWTGLQVASDRNCTQLEVFVDSELVARQMKGEYKVKNDRLKKMYLRACKLVESFEQVTFTHVNRDNNKKADALVNQALDQNGS